MRGVLLIVLTLAVGAALEAAFYAYRFVKERRAAELQRRLRTLASGKQPELSLMRQGRLARTPALDELLRHLPVALRVERLLEQADLRFTVAQLITLSAALGATAAGLAAFLEVGVAPGAALAAIGCGAPLVWVLVLRDRRSRKLSEELPDALEMMARSLRAGHSLASALQVCASELPEPINIELGRAYEAQNLGLSLERTVLQMCERAPKNRDLRIFAVSVVVQKETGGNLAEILDKIAETIRARYRFYGKLRALTAEGRASGLILAALPLCMMLFLMLINPHYLQPVLATPLGHTILAYALVSWLLGIVWLQRMTKMEI